MILNRARRWPQVTLLAVLLLALGLRLLLLLSPHGEMEADEAIVGIMGLHILQGERPAFYYMQPYMGSLEAYLAAGSFALLGSSPLTLKLVPLLVSVAFVGLVYATGIRIGGWPVGLASGLYAALPPAFAGLWSLKARGGYVETLVTGQLLLLLAMGVRPGRPLELWRAAILGLLAGLGIWTNLLVLVYLVPVAGYLIVVLGREFPLRSLAAAAVAFTIGAFPLLEYNAREGLATASAMLGGTGSPAEVPGYIYRFFRYSLPVLVGLAQGSSSPQLFWPAFQSSPAGQWPVAAFVAGLFLLLVAAQAAAARGLFTPGKKEGRERALLGLLLVVVPAAFVASKFRELVTEPRYLLPLFSAAPLLFTGLVSPSAARRRLATGLLAALLALNLYGYAVLRPELNMPDTAADSTTANRAELAEFLLARGWNRVYADYWIAYPLAFESGEKIATSVSSGGFNRYVPYSHLVSVAQNPVFVFISGSREEQAFTARMEQRGVVAVRHQLSVYSVFSDPLPLDLARP